MSLSRDKMATRTSLLLLFLFMQSIHTLKKLQIGGIFPMTAEKGGWAGGQGCLPAAEMALSDVNKNISLLPGYELILDHHDSKCQPGLGAKEMYNLLYKPPTKVMLLSGCSLVTTIVAEAAIMWNLIVLSYGASSPALSNRDRFPSLFRTHPSATIHNPTRIELFKRFNWKKIAILQSVEELFASTSKDLERACKEAGIKVISRQSFLGKPKDAISNLRRMNARIIVGLFYETEARRVFCEVYKQKLYGPRYVWFLIGWYDDAWYTKTSEEGEKIDCTEEEMREAVQYHFTTEASMLSRDKMAGISNMTGNQFKNRLLDRLEELKLNYSRTNLPTGFVEAPLAYDAIWAMALAFNCTMTKLAQKNLALEDFEYKDIEKNKEIYSQLYKCMTATEFKGVSGTVLFTQAGDRIARTQIEQMQDGVYKLMGFYDEKQKPPKPKLTWNKKEKFHDGEVPPDSTKSKDHLLTVSMGLYGTVCFVATLGIFTTGAVVFFNWKFAYRRHIQQSQPQCNNLMVFGCILCFVSLFLFGLPADGLLIPKYSFSGFCHARVSVLLFGFTLAYGSMFAKVWIVHRMGASEHQEFASAKEQPIPAWKFYAVVIVFLIIDVILVVIWIIIDPMKRMLKRFPPRESKEDNDLMLNPILELCQSRHQDVWIGIIFGYKGLLLLFGLFLAYESRNLKLRYVNDSRFVSLAIYNVAILSLITGPIVTLLIRDQENANFAFISATVLLCVFISLGLLFVPKILYVVHVPPTTKEDGSIVTKMTARKLTHAEQERSKQLILENEDLQKQIQEKEIRILELRKRLERRLAQVGDNQTLTHRHTTSSEMTGESEGRQSTIVTTRASIEVPPQPQSDNEALVDSPLKRSTREESSGYKSQISAGTNLVPLNTELPHKHEHADVLL